MLKSVVKSMVIVSLSCIIGCGATHTALNKKDIDVQSKMSDSIFLEPVAPEKRIVFLQIRNTSDKSDLVIDNNVRQAIKSKGYTLTENPDNAQYMVQANILQVSKTNLKDNQNSLSAGFGGAVVGTSIGGLATNGKSEAIAAGGLIGSVLGLSADAMVKDVVYTIITDLQISEKVSGKNFVRERLKSKLSQGSNSITTQKYNTRANHKKYQTRIVSTANKANLKFDEALPFLIAGLSNSISGIL